VDLFEATVDQVEDVVN